MPKPRQRKARPISKRKAAVAAGFRSGFEQAIADDLTKRGIPFEYESTTFDYIRTVRGGLCATCKGVAVGKRSKYTVDFDLPGGVHIEAKGRFLGADRAKLKLIKQQYPESDIRLLFQVDHWTTKLKRQSYSEWATKQGYTWAVGKTIPAAWCG